MRTFSRRLIFAFCLISLIHTAPAKDPIQGMDSGKVALHYLSPGSVDFKALLPAPPKADSKEQQAELDLVLRVQDRRTDEEVARAKAQQKLTMAIFAPAIGEWFTAENLPLTAKLLKTCESDVQFFTSAAKKHFARPRPTHDPRVLPLIDGENEPSYPSGHSTRGTMYALIIAELDSESRDGVIDRSREFGWNRVIAGVHYPTDLVAGRVLAKAAFQAMAENADFREDLYAAKAEFAAAKAKASK